MKEKKKHSKKHKKRARSSSSEEVEWVEAKSSSKSIKETSKSVEKPREESDWLDQCLMTTKSTEKVPKEKKKERDIFVPGQHERELNPFWKEGGSGLPSSSKEERKSQSIGDGGKAWARRAYDRILETAQKEGIDPEDVARERWGSLDKLKRLVGEVDDTTTNRSSKNYNRPSAGRSSFKAPSFDDRVYSRTKYERSRDEGRFQRPKRSPEHFSDKSSSEKSRSYSLGGFRAPNFEDNKYSEPKEEKHKYERQTREGERSPKQYESLSEKKTLTESDLNHLNAKLMKAEMLGNEELALKLKQKIESIEHSKKEIGVRTSDRQDSPHSRESSSLPTLPERKTFTESDLNFLSARLLKAEMLGNNELAAKIKQKIESIERSQKEVVLTKTDSRGFSYPLVEASGSRERSIKRKFETHNKDGERERYLRDDDNYSLKQMVQNEKMTTSEQQNTLFMGAAGKLSSYTDDYDMDDALLEKVARKKDKTFEVNRTQAIKDFKRHSDIKEKCIFCRESKASKNHLIISESSNAFLTLPHKKSLTPGHCLIVPFSHAPSTLLLDEDVWGEMKEYINTLVDMFAKEDQDVLFFEMSKGTLHHTYIECIPVDREIGDMAPIYFKKALLEAESEWADNKSVIDCFKKDHRHSIPKGLPYFYVKFGKEGGYGHVIEDKDAFPHYFALEIVGNLLDVEPFNWRKPPYEHFEENLKKVNEFKKQWDSRID